MVPQQLRHQGDTSVRTLCVGVDRPARKLSDHPVLPIEFGNHGYWSREAREVVKRLYYAIPASDVNLLRLLPPGIVINEGYVRGGHDMLNVVASYNNTRANEQEIVEWFERALLDIQAI